MTLTNALLAQSFGLSGDIDVEELGNAGGFSGAQIWRVSHLGDGYALRRWPREHPNRERLQFIHSVQAHFSRARIACVPELIKAVSGETFIHVDDAFWELSRWMPGEPTFHSKPTDAKLVAAMETLAALHSTAEELTHWCSVGVSPGLRLRSELTESSSPNTLADLRNRIDDSIPQLTELSRVVIANTVRLFNACRMQLRSLGLPSTKLFPCLRDIWHDHVFFAGDAVTGIIDFGAMQIESPACDIARLLGSLVRDDRRAWDLALRAYQAKRQLSPVELAMIPTLDIANVTFSGVNWVRWLYKDRRHFADMSQVEARLVAIAERQRTTIELMRI